jgi:drug/metabolite transporter (DMT)-like permease
MIKIYAELLLATALWGLGFITAAWAVQSIGPIWISALRFFMAIALLDLPHRLKLFGLKPIQYTKKELCTVFWPGFFLTALMIFQTWALRYTTATKCGFITVLYVLFIPLLERIYFKVPFRKILFIWIFFAILGSAMICGAIDKEGISNHFWGAFNFGDFLTLICSLAAAAQFLAISRKVNLIPSPVKFHIYQSFWVVLFCTVLAIPIEGFDQFSVNWDLRTWLSLAQLGFLSSGLAFLIQVRAQRSIAPSTAGIFILLESPWSMFFAYFLMNEKLTTIQILGAVLILVAAICETLSFSKPTLPKPAPQ